VGRPFAVAVRLAIIDTLDVLRPAGPYLNYLALHLSPQRPRADGHRRRRAAALVRRDAATAPCRGGRACRPTQAEPAPAPSAARAPTALAAAVARVRAVRVRKLQPLARRALRVRDPTASGHGVVVWQRGPSAARPARAPVVVRAAGHPPRPPHPPARAPLP
jgi:hypothetical protein